MSDRASALQGASFEGQISIADNGLRGMITLRGDLSSDDLRNVVTNVTGQEFPKAREACGNGETGLCWMSPDELLILLPHGAVAGALEAISAALEGQHHLAVDVSDARAVISLEGDDTAIREVLAKLTPADMRKSALTVGEMRRTRLAQVAAAVWFREDTSAEVICFRSVADYVWGLLVTAAEPGSEVVFFR